MSCLLWDKQQLPWKGQCPKYVLTIDEAVEFLNCLPDSYTNNVKAYIQLQFLCVTGGDAMLHDEINSNEQSNRAGAALASQAIGVGDSVPGVVTGRGP